MSTKTFYELQADPKAYPRWYLGSPTTPAMEEVDPRIFTKGVRVEDPGQLLIPLRRSGQQVDFNFCDFDMVVSPKAFNAKLEELAGAAIQRIPVMAETCASDLEILNVIEIVNCLDEHKSLLTKWSEDDGRPDKIGQIRMVVRLAINPNAAKGHHIFRVAGWPLSLIVSEEVRGLFEREKVSGARFEPVG